MSVLAKPHKLNSGDIVSMGFPTHEHKTIKMVTRMDRVVRPWLVTFTDGSTHTMSNQDMVAVQ